MRHLHAFDSAQPDGLLLALSLTPGVDASKPIRTESVPKPAAKGHTAVHWTQDGLVRSAEGRTLGVALRAAVRQARQRSANVGVTA